jgi:2-methylcitrate dehydratase
LPDVADIVQVDVQTLQIGVNIMAGDPEKWRPSNRETADHSMPYTVAVALMYGSVDQSHFDDEYLRDQRLLNLVARVKVGVSEEANRRAPEAMLCDLEVVTGSGQRYSSRVAYHKGHFKNPLTDSEVEDKFRSLAGPLLPAAQTDALLDRLWHLDDVDDVGEIFALMKIQPQSPG